ncbi:MAG: helix-turn-helix domain-containing protein [Clostridiales bacterium]|nr:helix-turn-helix domain-containing protein [Clostridiales bacterium]
MELNHKFSVPIIENYEAEYYFSYSPKEFEARIFPPHVHDMLEFYVLIDGNVSFMVENDVYKLSPGDIIMSKPNEMHNCILNSTSLHKHLCIWFDTSCSFLFSAFLSHEYGKGNLISPSNDDKQTLLNLYQRLEDATNAENKKVQFITTLEILNIYERSINTDSLHSDIPLALTTILNDINNNFAIINSLQYIIDKYFISHSTLNRLFKQHLRTSPRMYLETKKLAYSRMLLKEGKSVLDACMLSGFSDYSNYIRLFKNRFGITPKQYRDR